MKPVYNKYFSLFGLLFAVGLTFYYLRFAITPFAISLIIAYLSMPLMTFGEKYKIHRGVTAIFIVLFLLSVLFYAFGLLIPFLINKILIFSKIFTTSDLHNQNLHNILVNNFSILGSENIAHIENSINNIIVSTVNNYVPYIINHITSSGSVAINVIVVFIPCPIIIFYMLRDWKKMINKIYNMIPRRYVEDFVNITDNVGSNLSKYLRGQIQVCLLLSVFYSIPLYFLDLNYGIPIGIMTGCLAFIPYIGVIVSATVTTAVAIVQFGDIQHVLIILGILMIGQGVDGSMITPRIIGDKVNIHPTWVILGLFTSIVLFGTIGAIFALPITASGSVIVKFIINKYIGSNYYNIAQIDNDE